MTVSVFLRKRKEMHTKLWTTNFPYARPIFHATMARGRFFQILRVSSFYDKTTSNQRRSTDKLVPIRDVFERIVSRFEMACAPNGHITSDEQLAVCREKCPFHMLIKSKLGKVRDQNLGCCLCKEILCLQNASIHRPVRWSKGEEAGPSRCQVYGLSHVWKQKML